MITNQIWLRLLRQKELNCSFRTDLKVLCAYCIFHLITIFLDSSVPVALLYGPVLYRLYRSLTMEPVTSRIEYHLHQVPFYAMTVLSQIDIDLYHAIHLPAMPLSIVAYGLYIGFSRSKIPREASLSDVQILKLLTIISLAISVPLFMFASQRHITWDWGFGVGQLTYYILAFCVLMLGAYVFFNPKQPSADLIEKKGDSIHMVGSLVDSQNLSKVLIERQLYLDPLLSLEKFASEVGLPKHKCTKLIQIEHGKSFYQLIAEYRIEHASRLLKQDVLSELTIESIAESCGFNSKASFNRYFRDISGCTPSEYRRKFSESSDA